MAPGVSARESEHFDRLVAEAGDFNPFTDRGWSTLARRFEAALPGGRDRRVLDIGCGTGRSRQVYAAAAASYTGVDLSLGALATGRRPGGGLAAPARCLGADAVRLPFADASFDVAAFSSVLHHLPDRRAALAEALRVLRPGGLVFAFDPNVLHPAMLLFRHPGSPLYSSAGVSPDERPLLPRQLRQDFAAAGYDGIRQRCQSDLPYRAVAPQGLDALLPVYNRLDWLWEKLGFGRWFGTFVVTWARRP